ncbi:MAG: ornithine carbamoyltransferase [Chloroflexota bacterium]|nr:ornithine carbamoyltransferase [Chloroflexota bacterium]
MTVPFARPVAHLLSMADLDPASIEETLEHAAALKAGRPPTTAGAPLAGRSVALIFEKPSLRTRVSFEVGISRLGGQPISLHDSEIGLGVRESVQDATRTLERYVDAIVARVRDHSLLEQMAEVASIPIVNALSDVEHPCQALADALTLQEQLGDLRGRQLVFVGDGNNVAASLILVGASLGMNVRAVTPTGYEPDPSIVERAVLIGRGTGARIELMHDPVAGVRGADAVYTDVWTSMGHEAEQEARQRAFPPYALTASLMANAPDAIVMHCLPAHRGEEIDSEVLDGPRSVVLDQAENRLWVQMAVLQRLIRPRRATLGYPEPVQLPLAIGSRTTGRPARG